MARSKRLREIDLNLLPVLRSLFETHSVARTAAALSLTPSAVSHALARLRATLQDELFVRAPTGLVPTPRAARLADELGAGLAAIERALGGGAFDPRTATASFRVATTDFGARLIVPKLLAVLDAQAPGVQVQIKPLPVDTEEALASGDADLMIGVYAGTSTTIYRRLLFAEQTAVLARRGHPRIKRGKLALEDYLACSHVLIAPRGRQGSRIDTSLAEQGRARRIGLMIPDFLLGPHVVAETELLLSAGQRLLRSFVGQLPVQVVPLPFELPAFEVHMVWHARVHGDPAFVWFRNQLAAVHGAP
ncbi:MAG TPA: LysR family transcriptional regulator [Kofleriaceae bacterium]|nr:LysR family transcriptional regulator [Kofleriaceae bacterium]